MKQIILTTLAFIAFQFAKAQTTEIKIDTTKNGGVTITIGGDGIKVKQNGETKGIGKRKNKKNKKSGIDNGLVLDLGWNQMIDQSNDAAYKNTSLNATPAISGVAGKQSALALNNFKSMNVGLYPFAYRFHNKKDNFALTAMLGFNWYNYRFENDVKIGNITDSISSVNAGVIFNTHNNDQKKVKLGLSYVTLPLMLQAKPKFGKRNLTIGAGASFGYMVKGWYKSKENGGSKDRNTVSSAAFNEWQTNIVGELGFGSIRLYGTYGLNTIFSDNLDQKPVTFGIRFFGL
jgi:hypothetical protein